MSGTDYGDPVVKLTQMQIAQVVSIAVSQALTHQMQQIENSPPSATTAAYYVPQNTTTVQQIQTSIRFDVPAFEGDSTASSLA